MSVTAAPSGRRYSVQVMQRAQEHRAAGWSLRRTRELLEAEFPGPAPSDNTILAWTSPEFARRHLERAHQRNLARATARRGDRRHTPAVRLKRMQALAAAGLAAKDVARVIALDYGDVFTRSQVIRALAEGRYPRRHAR